MRIRHAALCFCLALALSKPVYAFTVDTTDDTVDASIGDGACADDSGRCSLRAAVQEANSDTAADTIEIPAGTYLLALTGDDDTAAAGDLDILYDTHLKSTALQDEDVVVDAGDISERAFQIHWPAENVTMENFTIQNGSDDSGGAVYNQSAALTLNGMSCQNNTASDAGGAISHLGTTLTLSATTITDNSAHAGGGIFVFSSGNVSITNSSEISSNQAEANGGGILVDRAQMASIDVLIESSKVNSNTVTASADTTSGYDHLGGAGLYYFGTGSVQIENSEFKGNTGTSASSEWNLSGGGLHFNGYGFNGSLSITDSTLENNGLAASDGKLYGAGMSVLYADQLTLSDSTISENSLSGTDTATSVWGSGFYVSEINDVTIADAVVSTNAASVISVADSPISAVGNLIETFDDSDDPRVTISNSHFNGNSIELDSTGSDDVAYAWRAGLSVENSGTTTITDSGFSANTIVAEVGGDSSGDEVGGAGLGLLGSDGSGVIAVANVQIQSNSLEANAKNVGGAGLLLSEDFLTCTIEETSVSYNTITITGDGDSTTMPQGAGISLSHNSSEASVTISNSTIDHNDITTSGTGWSQGHGAGIFSRQNLILNNSTISSNTAYNGRGAGLYVMNSFEGISPYTKLANVTITGNASDTVSGLFADESTVSLKNTIIAANAGTDERDCYGSTPLLSEGYNFIGNIYRCDFTTSDGDQTGDSSGTGVLDPLLGTLRNNGGSTRTHLPKKTSPVIDAGNPDGCSDSDDAVFATDQRGKDRPIDANGDGTAVCDIGAVERQTDDKDIKVNKIGTKIERPTGIEITFPH